MKHIETRVTATGATEIEPPQRRCPRIDADVIARSCQACDLKKAFDVLYHTYNHRKYVSPDPLQFLYDYDHPRDREIVGIIASSLAYGRVTQILKSVSSVLDRMKPSPSDFLHHASRSSLARTFADFRHRYTAGGELADMLFGLKGAIERYGSLQQCFIACLGDQEETIVGALRRFMAELAVDIEDHCKSLLPSPTGHSASKRMNLFLRWMVRSDDVDPGGWDQVDRRKLIVPLDTHMHKIGIALHFTKRKTADIRTAHEITSAFRTIAPDDPVKYDFSLTRLGIRPETDLKALLEGIRIGSN